MRHFARVLLLLVCLLGLPFAHAGKAPDLLLAQVISQSTDITQYLVSEKLDGVRAYWDGQQLMSRQGNVINAPATFLKKLPKNTKLDGELWVGRGQFEQAQSIVSSANGDWSRIRYMLFELPEGAGDFATRYRHLRSIAKQINSPQVQVIEQRSFATRAQLDEHFNQLIAQGAEGLMLHRKDALYSTGRNNDLLKLKPYLDEEATVVAYIEGKGKYTGMMGSVEVETEQGVRFKVGSGFTDADRKNPPPIGSKITYRYQNLTQKGKPRHPRFLRRYQPL